MPSRKKDENPAPLEDIRVTLKPILNIPVKVWVPSAWVFLILLSVFLLLVLPGIRRNGTILTVHTVPPGAEVIHDGRRLGVSGEAVFAPRGDGDLVVRKGGFNDYRSSYSVRGRVFASRLFPRREDITVTLQPLDSYDPLKAGLADFRNWSTTGPENGRYSLPSSLTEAARNAAVGDDTRSTDLWKTALPHVLDSRHLADLFRSESILISAGGAPSVASLVRMANRAVSAIDENADLAGNIALLTQQTPGPESLMPLAESRWAEVQSIAKTGPDHYNPVPPTVTLNFGDFSFVSFQSQTAPLGDMEVVAAGYDYRTGAVPVIADIPEFAISTREVSNRDFALFLEETPSWSVENRVKLVAEKKADGDYLKDWNTSGPAPGTAARPVVNISWYAANAYADWFTETYLTGTGYVARLPLEQEWELSARWNKSAENTSELDETLQDTDIADTGRLAILGMAGNVREWCENPFRFNAYLFPADSEIQIPDTDRTVRGGAFIDARLAYPSAVRGSLPASVSSPVIGFRLSLVPAPRS